MRGDMEIKHEKTSGGDYVQYTEDAELTTTQRWLTVPESELAAAAFTAQNWHGGQWSALYRLSCGDYTFATLARAEVELRAAMTAAENSGHVSGSEWLDARSALETLSRVTSHFEG
jgi:hypothetical protein